MDLSNVAYTNIKIKEAFGAVTAADIPTSDESDVQTKLTNYASTLDTHTTTLGEHTSQLAEIAEDMAELQNTGVDTTARGELENARDGETSLSARLDKMPTTKDSGNLVDGGTITSGKYINGSSGAEVTSASFGYVTLPVTAGAYYIAKINTNSMTATAIGAYFDAEGNYLSTVNIASPNRKYYANGAKTMYIFRAPDNAVTAKLNFSITDTTVYVYQDATRIHDGLSIEDKWLSSHVMHRKQSPFVYNVLADLPDMAKITWAYIGSSGNFSAAAVDFCMLAPIPCAEGERYEVYLPLPSAYNGLTYVGVFLDANFGLLGTVGKSYITGGQLTIPTGAAYMALYYDPASLGASYVRRVYTPTDTVLIKQGVIHPSPATILKGKKWAHLADSIGWYNYWQPYVVNALGLTHINCGLGSSCLAGAVGAARPAFYEDVRLGLGDYASTLTNTIGDKTYSLVIPNDPDIVTIMGGPNDSFAGVSVGTDAEFAAALGSKDKTNYKGAYSYIIETLLTWKPSLRILLFTPYEYTSSTQVTPVADFAQATRDVGKYYGLEVVDWYAQAGFNKLTLSTYTTDGIHMNTGLGAKRLAEPVIATISKMLLI